MVQMRQYVASRNVVSNHKCRLLTYIRYCLTVELDSTTLSSTILIWNVNDTLVVLAEIYDV
jgi:hypothetical protein